MSLISVDVEIDSRSVLCDVDDEELLAELASRWGDGEGDLLLKIYEEFRLRGDAPQSLKEFVWKALGRVL